MYVYIFFPPQQKLSLQFSVHEIYCISLFFLVQAILCLFLYPLMSLDHLYNLTLKKNKVLYTNSLLLANIWITNLCCVQSCPSLELMFKGNSHVCRVTAAEMGDTGAVNNRQYCTVMCAHKSIFEPILCSFFVLNLMRFCQCLFR